LFSIFHGISNRFEFSVYLFSFFFSFISNFFGVFESFFIKLINSSLIHLLSGIDHFFHVESNLIFNNFSVSDFLFVCGFFFFGSLDSFSLDLIRDFLICFSFGFEFSCFSELSVEFSFSLSKLFNVSLFNICFLYFHFCWSICWEDHE